MHYVCISGRVCVFLMVDLYNRQSLHTHFFASFSGGLDICDSIGRSARPLVDPLIVSLLNLTRKKNKKYKHYNKVQSMYVHKSNTFPDDSMAPVHSAGEPKTT